MSEGLDRSVLPIRRPAFNGVANQTLGGSVPDWGLIGHVRPPAGAPNVLLVLIDDAGFGNPATFGGPIDTPNYDRMAAQGLRYNRFHVTAMCSPTRAALLTGRNHHAVGMGGIPEFSGGFPGYSAMLPRDAAPFPKILQENGYSTAGIGKWHLTPEKEQGPAGPFNHWPNAWGFDYFWGFLAPEAGQYDTMVAENQRFIGVQEAKDGKPFYFPEAMTDQAIDWIHGVRGHDPEKPWFLYYSTGCSHAPHHVGKEWSEKYKGHFNQGWDKLREETFERQKMLGVVPADAKLTPRDELMPAWGSLSENSKRLFAHQMEVYAGYSRERRPPRRQAPGRHRGDGRARRHAGHLDLGRQRRQPGRHPHGDVQRGDHGERAPAHRRAADAAGAEVGRLGGLGHRDDVPALLHGVGVGGQHAIQMGQAGRLTSGRYPGPLVVRWPRPHHRGRRAAVAVPHVSDVGPTILDVAGIPQPTHVDGILQQPMTGVSFAGSLADANAPERHTQQYFENFGNRAMYKDGWWLSMRMPRIPWRLDPACCSVRTWGLGSR